MSGLESKMKTTFYKILQQLLCSALVFSLSLAPLHFANANFKGPPAESDSTPPLIDDISSATLDNAGIARENLKVFQHKYTGKDIHGKLQTTVVDYIAGDMTTEQMYLLLQDLKPEINDELSKNPKAKFKVNIVRDGITNEEVLHLKNIIDNLEILNPEYQEHSVSEDTRHKLKDLSKYFSSRYVSKNARKKAFVRYMVNGSIVGFSILTSYGYIPAAVGVGMALGAASGFFQLYYEAFSRYLVSAKTPAGEYARWYSIEVPVSAIIPIFLALGFNIQPEAGEFAKMAFDTFGLSSILSQQALDVVAKSFDVLFLSALAMTAQGVWDVYLSTKRAIGSKEIAVGTKSKEGENAHVFQRAGLLGIDVFKLEPDKFRQQIRPRDYELSEKTSAGFLKVSMAWATLAVIGLAGENIFPGKVDLGLFEMTHSTMISYGGFVLMGVSAAISSRRWHSNSLKAENPEWTNKEIKAALKQKRKNFWAYLFLDKYLVTEVTTQHPEWNSDQVRNEVRALKKNPAARERLRRQILSEEIDQPDLFETSGIMSCKAYFQ